MGRVWAQIKMKTSTKIKTFVIIFIIAITVLMLIADVSFVIALTDAIVEPLANAVWYFILDKWWASKSKK